MKKVWCVRHGGFWLDINACLAVQSNPEIRCPKRCPERQPPDDRGDAEKFWPKKGGKS